MDTRTVLGLLEVLEDWLDVEALLFLVVVETGDPPSLPSLESKVLLLSRSFLPDVLVLSSSAVAMVDVDDGEDGDDPRFGNSSSVGESFSFLAALAILETSLGGFLDALLRLLFVPSLLPLPVILLLVGASSPGVFGCVLVLSVHFFWCLWWNCSKSEVLWRQMV